MKSFDGFTYLYCPGEEFVYNHHRIACPDHVFKIPESEGFAFSNYQYSSHSFSFSHKETIDRIETSRINLQLKSTGQKIEVGLEKDLNKITGLSLGCLMRVDFKLNDTLTLPWLRKIITLDFNLAEVFSDL